MILDRRSAVPFHYQFERLLIEQIRSGSLSPGARLRTEREYAAQLGISLAPIRQALRDLTHQGYLERYKGRGTFVRERKIEEKITALPGAEPNTEQSVTLEVLCLERANAEPAIAERLGLAPRTPVILARRRGRVKGEPVLLLASYFPAARFPGLERRDLGGGSLYKVLADHYDCTIRRTATTIEVTPADDEAAALLAIAGGLPLLRVERRGYGRNRELVEYAEAHYRADRYRFL
ncbi:MAG: GntR family transcriptional regulator, partial [Chloroflexota bacterium]